MHSSDKDFEQRRRVLTLLGTTAVALPVLGLAGCGGGEEAADSGTPAEMSSAAESMTEAAKAPATKTDAEKAMESAKESAKKTMDDTMDSAKSAADSAADKAQTIATDVAGGMAKVDENDAQSKQLGYRHDASTVDKSAQPRYASGQQCSNCAIYQGGDAEWGGCPLFAGKQVKATGWCNAYVKAS